MREIKFRAWNNKFKEFKFMSVVKYQGGRGILDDWEDFEHSMWEQNTGLKDKNGVEIYEGDVLKINNDYDFIEFQDYSFCTHNQHEPLANYVYDTVSGYPKFIDDVFEVVGNIHENADLLEK